MKAGLSGGLLHTYKGEATLRLSAKWDHLGQQWAGGLEKGREGVLLAAVLDGVRLGKQPQICEQLAGMDAARDCLPHALLPLRAA